MFYLKNDSDRIGRHFFEPLFRLKFSYKSQKLTPKSLRIQDPKNSAEDGTLKFSRKGNTPKPTRKMPFLSNFVIKIRNHDKIRNDDVTLWLKLFRDEKEVEHKEEESEDSKIESVEKKEKVIPERSDHNEYVTQLTDKISELEMKEIEQRVLEYVKRKVAGTEAVMAWREINLLQHAQGNNVTGTQKRPKIFI